jgi:hypothetical protein
MSAPFAPPLQVAALMAGFDRPWCIAGGWAIDLFLGRETRPHYDVELVVFREDQGALYTYLAGWPLEKVRNRVREPWRGEWLELPVHQVDVRVSGSGFKKLEVLFNERDGQLWWFRRNMAVTRSLDACMLLPTLGVPILAPEIVLLFKAKGPQPKDESDFAGTLGRLSDESRSWLARSLACCHPGHPWLARL